MLEVIELLCNLSKIDSILTLSTFSFGLYPLLYPWPIIFPYIGPGRWSDCLRLKKAISVILPLGGLDRNPIVDFKYD